jgi:hypothetical protein
LSGEPLKRKGSDFVNKVAGSYLVFVGLLGSVGSLVMLAGSVAALKQDSTLGGSGALFSGFGGAASAAMVWGGFALLNLDQ